MTPRLAGLVAYAHALAFRLPPALAMELGADALSRIIAAYGWRASSSRAALKN